MRLRGRVRLGEREWAVDGDEGFVDDSAGYHERHTVWRWSAGIGRSVDGRARGLEPGGRACTTRPSRASAPSGWTASPPRSRRWRSPTTSRAWATCEFTPWCAREDHTRRLLFSSDYLQPFGSFEGELPGGLRLASGHGVMEWHDVRW